MNNVAAIRDRSDDSVAVAVDARAGNTKTDKNRLLEDRNAKWLDAGTTSAAGGKDPAMAPVGAFHRTANR